MVSPQLSSNQIIYLQKRFADLINYEGDDPTAPIDPMTYRGSGGDSLLHIAAFRGDVQSVTLLLDAGINPNIIGEMGYTPLHYAALIGDRDTASILIARGARTDATNEFGEAPDLSAF